MAGETVWYCAICAGPKGNPYFAKKPCGDATELELHPAGTGKELERLRKEKAIADALMSEATTKISELRAIVARLKDDELAYAVGIDPHGTPGRYEGVLDYRRRVLGEEP